ncbi:MAG: NfeD family protein [Ruminococcaceae bacterium]|nr:NfeD family protein [Oscillospiraceae bacterium]
MDQMMVWFWLIAAVVLAMVEAATASLVTIWFAGGAVLAMLCAWLGVGYAGQLAVFVFGSLVLLLLTRPLAKRVLHRDGQPTNADRIIGQKGIVTEDIDRLGTTGRIAVMGQSWAAVSEDGTAITQGEQVIVTKIQGVKAIVKKGE